jgi:hypothetical protein
MKNPGVYLLACGKATPGPHKQFPQLGGMTAVSLEVDYGGGAPCIVKVQTCFAGGRWRDVARFDFGSKSAVKHCNLEGLLSKPVTPYADLQSEGVNDGILGDALRCVVGAESPDVGELIVAASVR